MTYTIEKTENGYLLTFYHIMGALAEKKQFIFFKLEDCLEKVKELDEK